MTTLTSDLSLTENITTIIRPPYFYISGFTGIPHMDYYYVFLCFVYILSLVGNTIIMVVICMARVLHSPMYIAVFNLAFTDICESTALVPKLLDMFLFSRQFISYDQCLSNLFFVFLFLTMQSFNLTILSYDRLVAICCPLRYHTLVNHRSMFQLTGAAWVFAVFIVLFPVGFISHFSFCGSVVIDSYFCDPYPLYSLAAPCSDVLPNHVMSYLIPFIVLYIPMIFIISSYICIIHALFTITLPKDRHRAIKTCTSHLILVAIFYLPISIINIFSFMPSNIRIINYSLTSVLPPMLNPIIYVLKTEEFKVSIKRLLRRVIEQLRGACLFMKLELRCAYNLVHVWEGDEWKTAFSTVRGHYE
ncbi:olfactory receptor 146-like [Esox lucius]|uniref:olfactory receptor 146-like n=1 Tax=Esox lucius TaxID=8010 RepID=UPI0010BD1F11|nr:olfactory receptor 146-like [Esox lucius]